MVNVRARVRGASFGNLSEGLKVCRCCVEKIGGSAVCAVRDRRGERCVVVTAM